MAMLTESHLPFRECNASLSSRAPLSCFRRRFLSRRRAVAFLQCNAAAAAEVERYREWGRERLREQKAGSCNARTRRERERKKRARARGLIALPGARAASFTQPWAQIVYAVRIHATYFHFRYGISHLVPWKISLN